MGSKINPDLVNKVKETSKQIYNTIPEKPNSIFTRKRIFIGICVILGLIIIGSFGEEEKKETKVSSKSESNTKTVTQKSPEVTKVSVDSNIPKVSSGFLISQIKNPNFLYSNKNKGKEMIVSGLVDKIENNYVTLKVSSTIDGKPNIYNIKCIFKNPKELSDVTQNNKISIKGVFQGLVVPNIQFEDSTVVENKRMEYNCQLSNQEIGILIRSMNNNNYPVSLNKECFVKRICERFGPKKSKEWVILENIGNQGPYYSPGPEERKLELIS